MDFMKLLDQTVREIKREVNIKVLKVPEIEQKVLDATSNEPWGPHGSALAEISKATNKFRECQIAMNVLWTRLTDNGRNWRHVYKALAVIEYLVAHGSERAVDDIIEHSYQISSLSGFKYVEPNGKDMGINVRKKAETILSLLSDNDKIQEVRDKAAAYRDKYFGLSSTGMTYKSSSTSHGSNNAVHNDRYGGLRATKEGESFEDSYKDREIFVKDELGKSDRDKSRREIDTVNEMNNVKNESAHHGSTSRAFSKFNQSDDTSRPISSQSLAALSGAESDFDDFDPRGTATAKKVPVSTKEVDLFGDLMDAPTPPPQKLTINVNALNEVDLFVDTDFVAASPGGDARVSSQIQASVDLFASQPANHYASSSAVVDFFASPESVLLAETKSPYTEPMNSQTVETFAGVPVSNFDGSDPFGAFISHTDQVASEPTQNSFKDGSLKNQDQKTSTKSKSPPEDPFQVKSGIWADTLSRGLIDLNVTGSKKPNLANVGIVGGLSDGTEEKEEGAPKFSLRG